MSIPEKYRKDLNRSMEAARQVSLGDFVDHGTTVFSASGTMMNQNSNNVNITGGTISGVSVSGSLTSADMDYINLNASAGSPIYTEGNIYWDSDDHTLALQTEIAATTIQVGQEQVIRVVNKTGTKLEDGKVVYINGVQGNRPKAWLALATSASQARVIGVTTSEIEDNEEGYITISGVVRGIDTRNFSTGSPLYVSASVAGDMTTTIPLAPYHSNMVGYALNTTVNGSILVAIELGTSLSCLHDVSIKNPVVGQTLAYGNDELWKNNSTVRVSSGSTMIGTGDDYTYFESDGTMGMSGSATVWDDIFFPLVTAKQGQTDKPAFSVDEVAYLFPSNDTSASMLMVAQFPHSYKVGSDVNPHVHWKQTQSGSPVFKWHINGLL